MSKKSKTKPGWWTKEGSGMHLPEDLADLTTIHDLYESGDLKAAWNVARRVDTIVRECIPDDVWKSMGGKLLHDY